MIEAARDVAVHSDLRAALAALPKARPELRSLEPVTLAVAILESAESEPRRGLLAGRLAAAGVDISAAAARLREMLPGGVPRLLPLSPSVAAAAGDLQGKGAVASWELVRRLLRKHPEYGGGRARRLARIAGPATSDAKPVESWIAAVQALPDRSVVDRLHGRLTILALARLDPPLDDYLSSAGLVHALERELSEPIDVVLPRGSGSGLEAYGPLDRSPLHPDHPSAEDRLARTGFARALAIRLGRIWNEYASSSSPNSFILHLHGPWGSGKSSLLAMLRSALQPESPESRAGSRWIVIDFNAWAHQRLAAPWWQLLERLHRQAAEQLGRVYHRRFRGLWLRVTEWWWRFLTLRRDYVFAVASAVFLVGLLYWVFSATGLFERLFAGGDRDTPVAETADLLALIGTLISAAVVVGRSLVFSGVRSAQHFIESSADPMARISEHFKDLVGRIGQPVAIFIDDLDRCQEEYVIRLLEGIQTLFNDPRVVYIIAADRRWLHACYENTYARFQTQVREPGRSLGTLFLEKIFQLSVAVPRLSPEIQRSYWRYLVQGREVDVETDLDAARISARQEFDAATSEAAVFSRLSAPEASEDPVTTQARREAAVERLASERVEKTTAYFLEEFAHLLEPNPRGMKRLINAYTVHRDLAILSGLEVLVDVQRRRELALWTILSLRWPLLGDYLIDRVEEREAEPDQTIRELAASPEVWKVLEGDGVDAALDLDRIRALIGVGAREGGTSGAVA